MGTAVSPLGGLDPHNVFPSPPLPAGPVLQPCSVWGVNAHHCGLRRKRRGAGQWACGSGLELATRSMASLCQALHSGLGGGKAAGAQVPGEVWASRGRAEHRLPPAGSGPSLPFAVPGRMLGGSAPSGVAAARRGAGDQGAPAGSAGRDPGGNRPVEGGRNGCRAGAGGGDMPKPKLGGSTEKRNFAGREAAER